MSIVPLKKVTVCGLAVDKDRLIERLQDYGGMHLIPLRPAQRELEEVPTGRADDARAALRYLTGYPDRRRQVHEAADFDLGAILDQVLANRRRLREVSDRRDFLLKRMRDLEPWGEFRFPPLEELGGYRLWFYAVPHKDMARLGEPDLPFEVVRRDQRQSYVVVIARDEPARALPVPRTHTGARSLADVRADLDRIEIELEDVFAERHQLTKWIHLIAANLARAEDQAARRRVSAETLDDAELFAVQGWIRSEDADGAYAFATEHRLAILIEDPAPDDAPPSLLANPPELSGGEDLVRFYQTPGYRDWDPSAIVLFSFVLFFAMIMADAGYGLVLAAVTAFYWQRMGESALGRRMRPLAALLAGATVVYGTLAGGFFGLQPPEGSLPAAFHVLDLDDADAMMRLSIVIGVAHVALANGMKACRGLTNAQRLQPLGWLGATVGGLLMYLAYGGALFGVGVLLLIAGLATVAVFASDRAVDSAKGAVLRVLDGLQALTGISRMFGDVLSYLRLFALGLAGSSLAITINQLATQVADGGHGLGLLIGIVIVLVGHVINLALCLMSGVVHGLRLNVIEFFNWGLTEDGYPFRPFAKKEISQ